MTLEAGRLRALTHPCVPTHSSELRHERVLLCRKVAWKSSPQLCMRGARGRRGAESSREIESLTSEVGGSVAVRGMINISY